jgi:hypothetical protein
MELDCRNDVMDTMGRNESVLARHVDVEDMIKSAIDALNKNN